MERREESSTLEKKASKIQILGIKRSGRLIYSGKRGIVNRRFGRILYLASRYYDGGGTQHHSY